VGEGVGSEREGEGSQAPGAKGASYAAVAAAPARAPAGFEDVERACML
jgi:hypothetical protein